MNNIKFLELLKRVTGKDYSGSEKIKITSAKKAALESLCKKNDVYLNLSALRDGRNVLECQNKDYKPESDLIVDLSNNDIEDSHNLNFDIEIGCDIQSIDEFKKLITNNNLSKCSFIKNIFTKNEILEAHEKANPIESLCGIFAAKEAIVKTGKSDNLYEIEVNYLKNKPFVKGFSISISHSNEYVMAVAATNKN